MCQNCWTQSHQKVVFKFGFLIFPGISFLIVKPHYLASDSHEQVGLNVNRMRQQMGGSKHSTQVEGLFSLGEQKEFSSLPPTKITYSVLKANCKWYHINCAIGEEANSYHHGFLNYFEGTKQKKSRKIYWPEAHGLI